MKTIQARWKWILPDWYVSDLKNLDITALKRGGIQAVILDFDNTLIASSSEAIEKDREQIVIRLMREFGPKHVVIVSNKLNLFGWSRRMRREAQRLAVQAFTTGWLIKPFPHALRRAAHLIGVPPSRVLVIGDLLSTDIAAAKLAGMKSLLIHPVPRPERWVISLIRSLERRLFRPVFPKE